MIGRLINHSPWPDYLSITANIEAQWIDCCRIVRIDQPAAGIADTDVVPDGDAKSSNARRIFHAAIVLSAMRRIALDGTVIQVPGIGGPEIIPPTQARVMLGGKMAAFHGFLPGLFDEALTALDKHGPLYLNLMGGFGGACGVLAKAILNDTPARPEEFSLDWHKQRTPTVGRLEEWAQRWGLPLNVPAPQAALDQLYTYIVAARAKPAATLNTGLSDRATRDLLTTSDMRCAVQLTREGLGQQAELMKGMP